METYFIRHASVLDISEATRQRLWNERLIAIHYPEDLGGKWWKTGDNRSFEPCDYVGHAKQYVTALNRLANDGGYVCAQYFGQAELLLGIVPPNTNLSLLLGEWGSSKRVAVLKTLPLTNTMTLHPRDHSIIAATRPRQGTISRWHAVGDALAAIIEKRVQPLSWGLLSPDRQEVGCSEYLRLRQAEKVGLPQLQSLLLPIGRTLKAVDFIGIATDGKRIFAQVTSSLLDHAIDNGKLESLLQFVDPQEAHVILFCSCDGFSKQNDVHIVPVEEVFRTLSDTEWGRTFLRGIA